MRNRREKGLTLIELIMTVAVVGIIASVAWYYFDKTQMRSRRVDAIMGILKAQQFVEQCYSKLRNYADSSCDLPTGPTPADDLTSSPKNYYSIDYAAGSRTADAYELQAKPVAGGLQDGDSCAVFSVKNTGDKSNSTDMACWGAKP